MRLHRSGDIPKAYVKVNKFSEFTYDQGRLNLFLGHRETRLRGFATACFVLMAARWLAIPLRQLVLGRSAPRAQAFGLLHLAELERRDASYFLAEP
jgi:hypothetical protein